MLEYSIFKEVAKERFVGHLPTEFQVGHAQIHEVNKINGLRDGISVDIPGYEVTRNTIYRRVS